MAVHETLLDRYVGGDDLVVEVAWATWDLSVFSVGHGDASGVVAVPRAQLEGFLAELWAGRLDARLATEIRSRRVRRRRLASGDGADDIALYGGVADPSRLLPRERDVLTGRIQPPGGPRGRESKRRSEESGHGPRPRRISPRMLVAGVAAAGVLVAGSAVALTAGSNDDPTPVVAGPSSTTDVTEPAPQGIDDLAYRFTVTVTSFQGPEVPDPPPATFTVGYYCGSRRVVDEETSIPECSSDPRDAWAYFAPAFDLPEPVEQDFRFERALPTCTPGDDDTEGAGIVIEVEGFGTDTMRGTYEAGHEYLQCALDPSGDIDTQGYAIGYRMTATFVAERVDELQPVTTTTTAYEPEAPEFAPGPAPAPPLVGGA
jgi:hypothetical protein